MTVVFYVLICAAVNILVCRYVVCCHRCVLYIGAAWDGKTADCARTHGAIKPAAVAAFLLIRLCMYISMHATTFGPASSGCSELRS